MLAVEWDTRRRTRSIPAHAKRRSCVTSAVSSPQRNLRPAPLPRNDRRDLSLSILRTCAGRDDELRRRCAKIAARLGAAQAPNRMQKQVALRSGLRPPMSGKCYVDRRRIRDGCIDDIGSGGNFARGQAPVQLPVSSDDEAQSFQAASARYLSAGSCARRPSPETTKAGSFHNISPLGRGRTGTAWYQDWS